MDVNRIAVFLPSFGGGGAERVMVSLANAFYERGYHVDLVVVSAQGPYLKNVSPGVRVVDLGVSRVSKALLPLSRYLRKVCPVAMLSAMTHANILAIVACMLSRVKTRLVVSERSTISMDYSRASGLFSWVNYKLVNFLYPMACGVSAVSRAAAEDLANFSGIGIERIKVIYNPFDLRKIGRLSSSENGHPWFAAGQPPVILGIGRLTEPKDFSTLIRAYAQLRESRPARLLILGEGEKRGELTKIAKDLGLSSADFQMPGFVKNPFSYLARCAVFVLSSRWEGLPGALIEALACGAPVVSTDCPSGPREILENGRWGSLVPVGDVMMLAAEIARVLDTPINKLPDVRYRASFFDEDSSVNTYLGILGLPLRASMLE